LEVYALGRRLSEKQRPALSGILQVLVDITRMKRGPEDLPVSTGLLAMLVVASIVADVVLLNILPKPLEGNAAVLIAIGVGVMFGWTMLVLRVAGKPERYIQTMTAIFGFQLVMAPILIFSGWFMVTYQADPAWQAPAVGLRLIVEIWALVVLARILRSATEWPMFACVMLAITTELLAYMIIISLFPQPEAAAAVSG
jgi:hypothetical protein